MSGSDWLQLVETLGGLPLATLLIAILLGGYRKWWAWGYQLTECEARCEARVAASERREAEWRELALGGMQAARTAVSMAKERR